MKKIVFLLTFGVCFSAMADLLTPPAMAGGSKKGSDTAYEGGMMYPDGRIMSATDFEEKTPDMNLQNEGQMVLSEEKTEFIPEGKKTGVAPAPANKKVEASADGDETSRRGRRKVEDKSEKGEDKANHPSRRKKEHQDESDEHRRSRKRPARKATEEAVEGDENVETSEQPTEIERGQARQKRPQRGEGEHRRKKQQRPNRKQAEEPAGDGEVKSEQADPKTIRQGVVDDEPKVYDMKPIIYLYPTTETAVSVKVGKVQNLTHTYPKYEDGWYVTAQPNGDLKDASGRSYYALYWEGVHSASSLTDGFIVKGTDTINFLEEKLALLGLTEREANEFIVYWLPRLESNEYNFIRFETKAEIDENMPLYVTPAPDTVIRVMMEYRPADKAEQVKPQQLPSTPKREGFVVVEWGGTQAK